MDSDSDHVLDSLLAQWWQWRPPFHVSIGWKSEAPSCGQYQTSRQYDDINGALDTDLDRRRMVAVDYEIGELSRVHRAAITTQARALTYGFDVFRSSILPEERSARHALLLAARAALILRLLSAGVI